MSRRENEGEEIERGQLTKTDSPTPPELLLTSYSVLRRVGHCQKIIPGSHTEKQPGMASNVFIKGK